MKSPAQSRHSEISIPFPTQPHHRINLDTEPEQVGEHPEEVRRAPNCNPGSPTPGPVLLLL